jgi:hypothetical protein
VLSHKLTNAVVDFQGVLYFSVLLSLIGTKKYKITAELPLKIPAPPHIADLLLWAWSLSRSFAGLLYLPRVLCFKERFSFLKA